ncbi:MAG: 2-oxoacid:acceptor oxidoreductase family protein [Bacillota bacterium]|nr:2-oxoacid:acceptor oxidoreductase family protein [Bacillota bacterium]
MKEIRLHGIGGLGTVKAGELLVHTSVADGKYGNSIPFFGFERQGAPVTSYVRLDEKEIRPKNQVYNPDCVIVLDPTVMNAVNVFEGVKDNSVLVLNTSLEDIGDLDLPDKISKVAFLDASDIALKTLKNQITNTIMLAAFAKATGWVNIKLLEEKVAGMFGEKNREAYKEGLKKVKIIER